MVKYFLRLVVVYYVLELVIFYWVFFKLKGCMEFMFKIFDDWDCLVLWLEDKFEWYSLIGFFCLYMSSRKFYFMYIFNIFIWMC